MTVIQNKKRVEEVQKSLLDTADMLLRRASDPTAGLSPQGIELLVRAAATAFEAATRAYGDPPPDPGRTIGRAALARPYGDPPPDGG